MGERIVLHGDTFHATGMALPGMPQAGGVLIILMLCMARPGLGATDVEILRDQFGVPHIYADSQEGLFWGLGYAMASDRLRQMELTRAVLTGNRSRLLGPGREGANLRSDVHARMKNGGAAHAGRAYGLLSKSTQDAMAAFVRGVNAFRDGAQGREKLKAANAVDMPPWSVVDLTQMIFSRVIGNKPQAELVRLSVQRALTERYGERAGKAMTEDLLWQTTEDSVTSILTAEQADRYAHEMPGWSRPNPRRRHTDVLHPASGKADRLRCDPVLLEAVRRYDADDRQLDAMGLGRGSSAVVLSGARTQSGHPMLISHPSLDMRVPNPLYEFHLSGDGLHVMGVGVVGFPFVSIGTNGDVAYGQTNGTGDQCDVFMERLHPEYDDQYRHDKQWKRMTVRTETILVKGGVPRTEKIYSTVHGPVIAWDKQNRTAYSRMDADRAAWISGIEGFFGMMSAENIDNLGDAIAKTPGSQNFLGIDRRGNIGYWYAGRKPRRRPGHHGRLPQPGTGEFDWLGMIPFEELPHQINPPWGFLMSANNKPRQDWIWCTEQPSLWGPLHQRALQINRWAAQAREVTWEGFEHDNRRTKFLAGMRYNRQGEMAFLPFLLQAGHSHKMSRRFGRVMSILRAWDGAAFNPDSLEDIAHGHVPAAQTIMQTWIQRCNYLTFHDEFGELMTLMQNKYEYGLGKPETLFMAFQGRLSRDYFDDVDTAIKESRDDVILHALDDAMLALEERFASEDPSDWVRPLRTERTGAGGIAFPEYARSHNSYRLIVELGDPPTIRSVLFGGQAEDAHGKHFRDQVPLYCAFHTKPCTMDRRRIEKNPESRQMLRME